MLREIKENVSKWKDIPNSQTGRWYCKMAILPKVICRFNSISKNPSGPFCRNVKTYPKVNMELHGTSNSQNNLGKEKVRGLTLSNFKTYYNATVIKIVYGIGIWADI